MTMEFITVFGAVLTLIGAGISIGKFLEKVENHIRKTDDDEHNSTHKNNRR